MTHWFYLGLAIFGEVVATSLLKSSAGFTRLWPSLAVVVGYCWAFYFLSLALKSIPVGIAYAVWCGVGIVLIALIGWIFFNEHLDAWGALGMAMIMAGIIILNVMSQSASH